MPRVVIIGEGPAGISAAIYVKRSNIETIVIGKTDSAIMKTEEIENYYGFEKPISGKKLFENGILQAKRLGIDVIEDEVTGIFFDNYFRIKTTVGITCKSDALILATGNKRNVSDISGIKDFEGKGISYCAVCDAFFFRGKNVAVIGNGAYAVSEARELLPIVNKVTILTNGLNADIVKESNIEFNNKKINEISGNNKVEIVLFEDGTHLNVEGIFVAIGVASSSDFAKKIGIRIEKNKIVVDENQATSFPGVFAAGDCSNESCQIAFSVAQGAAAGLAAAKYLRNIK